MQIIPGIGEKTAIAVLVETPDLKSSNCGIIGFHRLKPKC
jgi:hypothetical protein